MMDLTCSKCSHTLYESSIAEAKEYNKDIKFLVQEDGNIDFNILPKYFVFSCHNCGNIKKISFEEYLIDRQKAALDIVLDLRLSTSINTSDKRNIREESGFAYCGICKGPYDGDGYCNKDFMSVCSVRRKVLEN